MKALIIEQIIPQKTPHTDLILSFNKNFVQIEDTIFRVTRKMEIIFKSEITFYSKDTYNNIYTCAFEDGERFRLGIPNDLILDRLKKAHNCKSYFSISSFNPDGYAIHFILVDKNGDRIVNIKEHDNKEKLQAIVDKSVESFSLNLHENFLDFTTRLLKIVDSTDEILKYKNGNVILNIMRHNINLYDKNTRKKLRN